MAVLITQRICPLLLYVLTAILQLSTSVVLQKLTQSRHLQQAPLSKFSLVRAQVNKGKIDEAECRGEEKFLDVKLDHYDFTDDRTFKLRYFISDVHSSIDGRPIFFYTGNEGDIVLFCNNSGLLWDMAPTFQAAVVFAEHRYYGKTLPFGNDSYKDADHLKYLSSELALADYLYVIDAIKASDPSLANSPVIAFGGSYGGMLATWMRLKFPNVIAGAIAASAPIWMFPGQTDCNGPYQVITKDFEDAGKYCRQGIQKSWGILNSMAKSEKGRADIASKLRLCSPVEAEEDVGDVKAWLAGTWFNLAMVDYPYPTSFLEPLPGYPIKAVCSAFTGNATGTDLLLELADALNVYYNYTGQATCFNISMTNAGSVDDYGWNYQSCTEMVMPSCTNGVTDMFEPQPWNFDDYTKSCQDEFGVTPSPKWVEMYYWGKDLSMATNIFFSNGALDPWSAGGVLQNISETVQAFIIPEGAHHLDLRSKTKDDPPGLVQARNLEYGAVKEWINAHREL